MPTIIKNREDEEMFESEDQMTFLGSLSELRDQEGPLNRDAVRALLESYDAQDLERAIQEIDTAIVEPEYVQVRFMPAAHLKDREDLQLMGESDFNVFPHRFDNVEVDPQRITISYLVEYVLYGRTFRRIEKEIKHERRTNWVDQDEVHILTQHEIDEILGDRIRETIKKIKDLGLDIDCLYDTLDDIFRWADDRGDTPEPSEAFQRLSLAVEIDIKRYLKSQHSGVPADELKKMVDEEIDKRIHEWIAERIYELIESDGRALFVFPVDGYKPQMGPMPQPGQTFLCRPVKYGGHWFDGKPIWVVHTLFRVDEAKFEIKSRIRELKEKEEPSSIIHKNGNGRSNGTPH